MPQEHELKCWPEFYAALVSGEKTFEVRKDDRGFRVGDVLWLREWRRLRVVNGIPEGEYSGREMRRCVTYVLSGDALLQPGFVCMALAQPVADPAVPNPAESPRPSQRDHESSSSSSNSSVDLRPLAARVHALIAQWRRSRIR